MTDRSEGWPHGYGYCHCGCGEKTTIARQTRSERGVQKGEPTRFVQGHNMRVDAKSGADNPAWTGGRVEAAGGYLMVRKPDHPHSMDGYVYEHRLVAEEAAGFTIPRRAVVHHVNGDPSDNRPENLVICEDQGYHRLLHQREEALEACGHASWIKCEYCGNYDAPEKMYIRPIGTKGFHRRCQRQYKRRKEAGGEDEGGGEG